MTDDPTGHRQAVEILGFAHRNPIPAASLVGPLLVSSMVVGYDPGTSDVPPGARQQVANVFTHVEAILTEANAGWDDLVRMTFYVPSLDLRPDINEVWTTLFPDPATRPARITHQTDSDLGVRCEFIAYVATGGR